MAKKKHNISGTPQAEEKAIIVKPKKFVRIIVPTGDDFEGAHRLSATVRYGKISFEVFARKNRPAPAVD